MATWQDEVATYRALGADDNQIANEAERVRKERLEFGATPEEVDAYFGVKPFNDAKVKEMVDSNLAAETEAKDANASPATGPVAPVDPVDSIWEAVGAGFNMSATVMGVKAAMGKSVKPEQMLDENAPMAYTIASSAGNLAGDLVPMGLAAAAATAAAPAAIGALGAAALGGAASFALPTAVRETLMEFYEKEEAKDFGEWWGRASGVFLDTMKSAATGAATMGVGGKVASALAAKGVSSTIAGASKVATEVGVMTSVGSALEGQVPTAREFAEAAILVGGLHAAAGATGAAAKKMRTIYAKTGIKPEQVLEDAMTNPAIKEKLLNEGTEMPKEYESYCFLMSS